MNLRLALATIFAIRAMAGPLELWPRETCYRVDCNMDTGDCQGTLPDCEMGYCVEDRINCLYVCVLSHSKYRQRWHQDAHKTESCWLTGACFRV